MKNNDYTAIMAYLNSRQSNLHNYCVRYQYDVLYYKYDKDTANEMMKPKKLCHFTYRQQYFIYHVQDTEPITCDYATAKLMLKKYSDELRHLKMFLIPECSKRRLNKWNRK